jgi:bifunctional non-homologous end joining protein LigD
MQRFPDGIGEQGFFHKDAPDYFPDWIARAKLRKENGSVNHILANDAATLVYLANQGCITPHVGLSRADRVDHPDRLIFDLDPSNDDFAMVRTAAKAIRELCEDLELTTFVQTTGSRGLHVVVPLDGSADFAMARDFARRLSEYLAARQSDALTVEQRKDSRKDRVFLDYLRNAYGQTAVAPYAVRAREGAPVATPLDWPEAMAKDLRPDGYTIGNIFRRLAQKDDPWAQIGRHAQSLAKANDKLKAMAGQE